MQTRNLTFIISYLISSISFGQVMFTNGGFEQYSSCPTGWDQTLKITGCTGRNDTPEYYNCSYGSANAYSGSGSVYLGAISNGVNNYVQEGINLQLTTPLSAGVSYSVSIQVKYGLTVWGDPSFDYGAPLSCFNLRFSFSNGNQSGRPTTYHKELDGGVIYSNSNNVYHQYAFTFTSTQSYNHLYIITAAADDNTPGSPNASCMSSGPKAYVYYHYIDDLVIEPESKLPVQLVYFDAVTTTDGVQLEWQTATEINNDYFSIERSIDGVSWKEITQVDGAGNSSQTLNYNFLDKTPIVGKSYYRLKQIDFNGEYSYSKVEPVSTGDKLFMKISPNPSNGKLVIDATEQGDVSITIYNMQGLRIYNQLNVSGKIEVDITDQPQGVYLVKILSDNNVDVQRIIKK